jgi:ribosomal protein S18 acetylase RimI-like enzyme
MLGCVDVGSRLQAKLGDSEELYGLLSGASAWLKGRGLRQWNPEYPRQRFVREIVDGHVWYWAAGGKAIGTVTLLERRPEYYPDGVWEDGVRAWYVCRFAVSRKLVGRRVGEQLLDRLEADAGVAWIQALRLDVTNSNPFLETYYAARGFERNQTAEIFGEGCALLEKAITLRG